jgi:hypothetical protein
VGAFEDLHRDRVTGSLAMFGSSRDISTRSTSKTGTRRYRVTRYGQRVMTAAIALHDDQFAHTYNAAA